MLAEELSNIAKIRFLFGDPTSVDELDPGVKESKSFELSERGLSPKRVLKQKYLAKRCSEWISNRSVSIRSISKANFLHGKLYLSNGFDGSKEGIVGSSNFSRRGLGGEQANLEINLAVSDENILADLQEWFNYIWQDQQRTEDVKQRVLEALHRLGNDYAPEQVYYKTLYELFRAEIEARQAGDYALSSTGFKDSQIWNALYEFQKDGAMSTIARLKNYNGCILADSVGLGKTYTALAIIKFFELRNERVLVLCPKKLFDNWSFYQISNNHAQNPFPEDRFHYTLLAHTDLSRSSGMSGGVNLANFNWENYDLIVIDESHNFRNQGRHRYERLLEVVISKGTPTKVLMLSATPVNTSLYDLRNQIYLMTERREDAFRESLGVNNLKDVMSYAQKQFKRWEIQVQQGYRDKALLLEELGGDFLRLLGGISISRSRRQIEQFYDAEMDRIGKFPQHAPPVNCYPPTDSNGTLSYETLAMAIDRFKLAVYRPTEYIIDPARLSQLEANRKRYNFNQQDSERFLVAMIRTNFLKRLESSAHSLTLTLSRTIGKIESILALIDRYQNFESPSGSLSKILHYADEEDEEFFINHDDYLSYRLEELNVSQWRKDLEQDKVTLSEALKQVASITPDRDGKLHEIKRAIRKKITNPTTDRNGESNRKLLVFTTFKDTALYLYKNLISLSDELDFGMAMVSGSETRATVGDNNFHAILTNFSPTSRHCLTSDNIDLLIATDCISEGQNLQDCDTVLNYDIHWNPVRLIQRFGRIDRIGSRSSSVHMVNYWPTADMEIYLKLENRVQARMALVDVAASGDEDPFNVSDIHETVQLELSFRDEQLLKLRDEILDLDDLVDNPTMSDFTLDHFFIQLLRYLERNKAELESMPLGAYAIADNDSASLRVNTQPGVIFFLRQRNAANNESGQQFSSPVHPYYFVYIQDNGAIRYGCTNVRHILAVFEATAAGKSLPIVQLCDRFDRETDLGRNMSHYDRLLDDSIAHIRQSYATIQRHNLRPDGARNFILPRTSEMPRDASNFELITWLVIVKDQNRVVA